MTTASEIPITNPLPQRYLTSDPGVGGKIKARPEDFLVDEIPLYQPEDAGEHLYLGIQKSNVPHAELMSCLRRHFGVTDRDIGFAGMKDKVGVTRQMVSIHLLKDPPTVEIPHKRIQVLWAARHRNKLRLGHLAGNRFSIRIREVDPLKAPQVLKSLQRLEREGVPNYFGAQRFGYRQNNHLMGAALLAGDWAGMLTMLLGTAGGSFPEYQRERRELFDAGKFAEAAALWTTADRSERIACMARANGRKSKDAAQRIGENSLAFWVSALQSAIFNRVLDWRIERGLFNGFIEGDLAFKHETRGVFPVTAEELANPELEGRRTSLEISPSGPLWGKGMMTAAPGSAPAEMEQHALAALSVSEQLLTSTKRSAEGARRPLRTILKHPEIDAGLDEHGQYIRVAFDLPRGAYATVVLREIMKNDAVEGDGEDE